MQQQAIWLATSISLLNLISVHSNDTISLRIIVITDLELTAPYINTVTDWLTEAEYNHNTWLPACSDRRTILNCLTDESQYTLVSKWRWKRQFNFRHIWHGCCDCTMTCNWWRYKRHGRTAHMRRTFRKNWSTNLANAQFTSTREFSAIRSKLELLSAVHSKNRNEIHK